MDNETLKANIIKIGWEVGFLKEGVQMDRYSKDKTIKDIELIQDHINELLKEVVRL